MQLFSLQFGCRSITSVKNSHLLFENTCFEADTSFHSFIHQDSLIRFRCTFKEGYLLHNWLTHHICEFIWLMGGKKTWLLNPSCVLAASWAVPQVLSWSQQHWERSKTHFQSPGLKTVRNSAVICFYCTLVLVGYYWFVNTLFPDAATM